MQFIIPALFYVAILCFMVAIVKRNANKARLQREQDSLDEQAKTAESKKIDARTPTFRLLAARDGYTPEGLEPARPKFGAMEEIIVPKIKE